MPFWRRLVAPHAALTGRDQRRQATFLSAFILALIVLAAVVEILAVALLRPSEAYTGYYQTIGSVAALAVAYGLSRTRHLRLAAALTVIIANVATFVSAVAEPDWVLGGLLDYLLLPVWLASVYFGLRELLGLLGLSLAGLLLYPLLVPQVGLDAILVGPFSFVLVTGAMLLLLTRYRDVLERDRQAELAEKELRYRTLVEQIPAITYLDAVNPADPAGFTPVYVSPQFDAWLGYSSAEYQRRPQLWRELVHPDDRPRVLGANDHFDAADAVAAQEYRLVTRAGRVLWVQDHAEVRWDAVTGQRLRQGVLLDITERQRAEERIRREAARAQALLRVAGRLNRLLDLEALLTVICEEAAQALEVPVAAISLYDARRDVLALAGAVGLPAGQAAQVPPVARAQYDRAVAQHGPVGVLPDLRAIPSLPGRELYADLGVHSLAFASLVQEDQLIGALIVLTLASGREYTDDDRMLLRGLADQAALAIVNTRLFKDAQRRSQQLQALRAIDIAIATNHNLRDMLETLLAQVTDQLRVDAAVVLLFEPGQQELLYGASRGFQTEALQYTRLRLGEGFAGQAALEQRVVQLPDLSTAPALLTLAPLLHTEGFASYYAAPLVAQGQVKGVLEVFHRSRLEADQEWLAFLEALAGQAAIAIDNTTLFVSLEQTNAELSRAYDATIEGWSRALDLRDKETEGHTQRVTEMTLRLAAALGLPEAERVHVRRGALLHDIGKMGIPDNILLKPGPLTDDEWAIMRRHPEYALEMLRPIDYLQPALDIPYCHHEKWDGTGYPRGLAGDTIPVAARLFAVVDVWDALSSDRPYRAAWSPERVRAHLAELAGTHFDPQVVRAFLPLIDPAAAG